MKREKINFSDVKISKKKWKIYRKLQKVTYKEKTKSIVKQNKKKRRRKE